MMHVCIYVCNEGMMEVQASPCHGMYFALHGYVCLHPIVKYSTMLQKYIRCITNDSMR